MYTIVSMSSTQKSKEPLQNLLHRKFVEACSWTAHVQLSKFPGPRHSPDRYATDSQKLTFGPGAHQHPFKAWRRKWGGTKISCTSKGMGMVSHCARLIYNNIIGYLLYQRVQDVVHQPNHYEKVLFQTVLKDAHLSAKKPPTNLNTKASTKPTSRSHCMAHQTM